MGVQQNDRSLADKQVVLFQSSRLHGALPELGEASSDKVCCGYHIHGAVSMSMARPAYSRRCWHFYSISAIVSVFLMQSLSTAHPHAAG